jgi:indolepyruvate ferredoxin oxidoreductase beta subunit
MVKNVKQFNMMVTGTGGQGLITVLQVISEAAVMEGYDVKTSELHGLSQRGGSVEVYIRFGKKVYSPLIPQGKADLIMGLEAQESLKGVYFANSKTNFVVNKNIIPIPLKKPLSEAEILSSLKKISKNVFLVPAKDICKEKLGTEVVAGTYLLSWAVFKKIIPLDPSTVLKALKKVIPQRHLDLNIKTFELAKE